MANPQLEDGFMRVANGIVDNICKLSLNGTEQKVIWCVIRYTYGFNRKSHRLWEESWNMCREQVRALSRQSDIISMVLRMDDVELLDLAFGFVRGCYNQQIKKEQEGEKNGI